MVWMVSILPLISNNTFFHTFGYSSKRTKYILYHSDYHFEQFIYLFIYLFMAGEGFFLFSSKVLVFVFFSPSGSPEEKSTRRQAFLKPLLDLLF